MISQKLKDGSLFHLHHWFRDDSSKILVTIVVIGIWIWILDPIDFSETKEWIFIEFSRMFHTRLGVILATFGDDSDLDHDSGSLGFHRNYWTDLY